MNDLDVLRGRIRRRLQEMGRSQEHASLAMGFSKDALNKFLNGQGQFSPRMARKVAWFCAFDERELLVLAGHASPARTGDPVRDALVMIEALPVLPDDRVTLRHIVQTYVERARLLAANGTRARDDEKDNGIGLVNANYGTLTAAR